MKTSENAIENVFFLGDMKKYCRTSHPVIFTRCGALLPMQERVEPI